MRRSAVVLCGGGSRRMGRDKAALPFGKTTLLGHAVGGLETVVDETIVAARPGQALPPLPSTVRIVYDDEPDQGPLVGLVTGLRAATSPVVFATAVDTPFATPAVVRLLFDRLGDADACLVEAEGRVHPLLAVYRRSVLAIAEGLISSGERRLLALVPAIPARHLDEPALRRVDPDLASITNVNTPEAYRKATTEEHP